VLWPAGRSAPSLVRSCHRARRRHHHQQNRDTDNEALARLRTISQSEHRKLAVAAERRDPG